MTTYPTVLLVDDDVVLAQALACAFERVGLELRPAVSVAEAIQRAAEWQPDIILLTLPCGVAGAGDVLNAVASRAPGAEVIVLTGAGTIEMALGAMRSGAFDYVCKPCRADELEMRIRRALEWRALQARALELERDATASQPTAIATLRDTERIVIQRALGATGGRRAHAARLLGISERNLYRKIHTYHLEGGIHPGTDAPRSSDRLPRR